MRYTQQPSNASRPKLFLAPHPMPTPYTPPPIHSQLSLKYESGTRPCPRPSTALNASTDCKTSHAKQSREELNRKEKQRMFKLNERIQQLKTLLTDAGVQTKKNKQAVLDTTAHYIEMLHSEVAIAQQKTERAERYVATLRAHGATGHGLARRVFEKATTPRLVVDMALKPVVFNAAFVQWTGLSERALMKRTTWRPYLCAEPETLEAIVTKVRETRHSVSMLVNVASTSQDKCTVNLVAAVLTDQDSHAALIEFSLIPVDVPQRQLRPSKRPRLTHHKGNRAKEAAAVYPQP